MKQFCFCFSIFSIGSVFSQDKFTNDSIPKNAGNASISYVELFAGGAFGFVDGFAGGASINTLYSNVLFSFGYVMNNEQGGLEYVEEGKIPINYYKHYRLDSFPVMIGFYHEFNLNLFNKKEDAVLGYGIKLFGNLGKYNYTGLAFVFSLGTYK